MRLIGHVQNETLARRLSYFLGTQNIAHQVESEEGTGGWALWIHSEEDMERARRILETFLIRPEDPAFAVPPGARVRGPKEDGPGRVTVTGGGEARGEAGPGGGGARAMAMARDAGHVTLAVTIACVVVAFVTQLGDDHPLVRRMLISERFWKWGISWKVFLPEVRTGEGWRLLSPAFVHFGWPHLLFNLWTFWSLGRAIEYVRGTPKLIGLMAGLALASNLGQYAVSGPAFGGLSGVIYGLAGYIWMLGRHRPEVGMALPPQMVVMMLAWLVICAVGAVGPVANTAHGVGLLAGMLWGRWEAGRRAA